MELDDERRVELCEHASLHGNLALMCGGGGGGGGGGVFVCVRVWVFLCACMCVACVRCGCTCGCFCAHARECAPAHIVHVQVHGYKHAGDSTDGTAAARSALESRVALVLQLLLLLVARV